MGIWNWLFGKKQEPAEVRTGPTGPPSAERVARRALVLSLVMVRASLEQFPGEARFEALHRQMPTWIDRLGLDSELEKAERDFLHRRLGRADDKVVTNASWRNEGVGVLAWALGRYAMPAYDEGVDPREAGDSVGFSEDLLADMDTAPAQELLQHAELIPTSEIDRFASHITIVNWRMRTYNLTVEQIHGGIEIDLKEGVARLSTEPPDLPRKEMD